MVIQTLFLVHPNVNHWKKVRCISASCNSCNSIVDQIDQQVNISLYLTEATALHHSRKLIGKNHHDVLSAPLIL